MVTTGFSRIHVAKYTANGSTVTYSGVREIARAKSMSTDITTTEDNNFYANNELAETEPASFANGNASITVDGLSADEEAFILGITESTVKAGETNVPVIAFGKNMNPPYVGIGAVKRMQLDGNVSYRAIILTKARFAIPPEAAESQEKNINWQTQALSAVLMRDDTEAENWKIIPKENFSSESAAVDFIVAFLGGKAA